MDVLIGKRIDLDMLRYVPDIAENWQAQQMIATLIHDMPEAQIEAALMGMLSKHLISVSDMCTDDRVYPKEQWDEKITDSINYLLILRALVEEEMNEED